ncbi:MAG: hypothetical protein ACLP8S_14890 [Solirubrobacteraceae bacterium]
MLHLSGFPARMLLRLSALAIACLAAFAGPQSASALLRTQAGRHVATCNSHRSRALKTTSEVLVWEKPTGIDPYSGGQLSTVYACLRPAGASVAVGQNATDGEEYIGNVATSELSITGTQVSDLVRSGLTSQDACYKYEGPSDPDCAAAATETVGVFNLTTRRSLSQPLAGAAETYAFAPAGAIAWEAPTNPHAASSPLMLQAVGFDPRSLKKGRIETLDTGDLGRSLQFTGLTLQWTNARQPKSQVLSSAS